MLSSTKKIERLLHAPDFLHDFVARPARLRVAEVGLDGAELAAEVAAASRFDESDRQVSLAREDRTIGPQAGERRTLRLAVDRLQAARRKIVDHAAATAPSASPITIGFGVIARLRPARAWHGSRP